MLVKSPTVGKSATFSKVDAVISETKSLMNEIAKLVTACFVCATKASQMAKDFGTWPTDSVAVRDRVPRYVHVEGRPDGRFGVRSALFARVFHVAQDTQREAHRPTSASPVVYREYSIAARSTYRVAFDSAICVLSIQ